MSDPCAPQPPPKKNDRPAVWDLVQEDIRKRDAAGALKYGVRLQPFNGRDPTRDAYEEALDRIVYERQAIEERRVLLDLLARAGKAGCSIGCSPEGPHAPICTEIAEALWGAGINYTQG